MTAQEAIPYSLYRSQKGCGGVLTDLYSVLMVILRQFLMKVGRKILALLFGQKSAGSKLVSSHETKMTAQEPFHICE
jgi:hypothetical protein